MLVALLYGIYWAVVRYPLECLWSVTVLTVVILYTNLILNDGIPGKVTRRITGLVGAIAFGFWIFQDTTWSDVPQATAVARFLWIEILPVALLGLGIFAGGLLYRYFSKKELYLKMCPKRRMR